MRTLWLWIACTALLCAARLTAQVKLDDERLRKAWSYLTPAEQDDALARFDGEAPMLPTFQNRLVRFGASLAEIDLGLVPRDEPTPFYDPQVHAPAQPIARHRLEPDSPAARRQSETMLGPLAKQAGLAFWRYDWAKRRVVRTAELDDRDRRFESALAGRPPNFDWAQAWVERALDGGAQQKVLAAFAHAYTDRSGNVYPGLTLYDAWASGTEMEMPDVDTLGVIHELLDDWKHFVAPVPESKHEQLYDRVGEQFVPAHRYRGLREALARTFLAGSVALRDGYDAHLERLHALWESYASKPADLAPRLPDADQLTDFLAKWTVECEEKTKLRDGGKQRRATLDSNGAQVRELWVQILRDAGALERHARPSPPSADGGKK